MTSERAALSPAQMAALVVLGDGEDHYCWKWASNPEGQVGKGCVNARAASSLRTLRLARTESWGTPFTGDRVRITDAGRAVLSGVAANSEPTTSLDRAIGPESS